MNSRIFTLSAAGILLAAPCIAQAPPEVGEVVMKTTVGSFKITSPGDQLAYGKIRMSFKGSCLIVGYDNKIPVVASPGLRVEYNNAKRGRIEYFGTGTITLEGRFRALQWMGQNLDMNWIGLGICRVYGEFDKNNNTGTYEIKGQKPLDWGNGGMTFSIPLKVNKVIPPKVKINGGG